MSVRQSIAKLMLVPTALVFVASAVAHGSTFFGIDPMERFPGVMFLHLAVMAVAGIAFFTARTKPGDMTGNRNNKQLEGFDLLPLGMKIVGGVLFAYCFVNFGLFMLNSGGGTPSMHNGKYELSSHGHLIRTLTAEEYALQRAYVVRGFSGHWLMFSWVALCILLIQWRLPPTPVPDGSPPGPAPGNQPPT